MPFGLKKKTNEWPGWFAGGRATGAIRYVLLLWLAVAPLSFVFVPAPVQAEIVTKADAQAARNVLNAIDKNRFKDALHLTRQVKSPDVTRVLMWRYMTHPNSPARFEDVRAFLQHQSGWPSLKDMLRRAEETMPADLSPRDTIQWFKTQGGPVSSAGKAKLGEALLALGQTEQGTRILRQVWIEGNFSTAEEQRFAKVHRKLLRPEDHVARLDNLIWEEKFWPARRQLMRVDEKTRLVGTARIWLMRREGNVDKAIYDVAKKAPEYINDAGLLYERLRWRRRKNRNDDAASVFAALKGDGGRPDKWWVERAYVARSYLQEGKAKEAYSVTAPHGLTPKYAEEYAEAEWLSGWIALTFLKNPARALEHFKHMHAAVNYPVSVARGAYWAGRAAEKAGNAEDAKSWFTKAANHTGTYYGQLARARLGLKEVASPNPVPSRPTAEMKQAFDNHQIRRAAQILVELNEKKLLRPFLITLSDADTNPTWLAMTAQLAIDSNRPDLAIRLAKEASRDGVILGNIGYPAIDLPIPAPHKNGGGVEAPLVLSVIRQESEFYVEAQSHVGARGLMQVMPATAKVVAQQHRLPYDRDRLGSDANYNLVIGQVYLADVIKEFDGSYPMAIAAYNAGPHRVKRWLKTFGDPRKGEIDIVDWIELIPYAETRNYVQRVLENLIVYRTTFAPRKVAQGD